MTGSSGIPDINIKMANRGASRMEFAPKDRPTQAQLPASPADVRQARAAQAGPRLEALKARMRNALGRGFGSKLSVDEVETLLSALDKING